MLIATLSLPHEAVALQQTFRAVPDLQFEAERIAAHSTEWVMPCMWAARADFDAVDEALMTDPTVEAIMEEYGFQEEKYYQLKWSDDVIQRITTFIDMEASILDATADTECWRLRVRFISRAAFDDFCEHLGAEGTSFDLLELVEPGAPRQTFGDLTPAQRDALVAAKEHGYYRVPRETTLRDVAEDLDISHQTLSEHLRRGTENLIEATITTEGEPVH